MRTFQSRRDQQTSFTPPSRHKYKNKSIKFKFKYSFSINHVDLQEQAPGGGILDQNGISWNHKSGCTASMPSLDLQLPSLQITNVLLIKKYSPSDRRGLKVENLLRVNASGYS